MTAVDKWGHTQIKIDKCTFTWTISNFIYLRKRIGEDLESPYFSLGPNDEHNWSLKLYPRGINESFKDHLSLYVCRKSGSETNFPTRYTISLLNARREKFFEQTEECQYNKNFSNWGFPGFIKNDVIRDEANCLLGDNGSLTICCEIAILADIVDYSSEDDDLAHRTRQRTPTTSVCRGNCQRLEKLFLDEGLSDVRLVAACGKSLPAHKNILSAASPVFEAMFEHEFKESKLNEVKIDDVDYEVLREMLRYAYAGRVEGLEGLAAGLLGAADKYEMIGLKEICEDVMCDGMSVDNVIEALLVSDRHNIEQLKVKAMNYVKAHFRDVVESAGFRDLVHVDTLKNIILAISEQ